MHPVFSQQNPHSPKRFSVLELTSISKSTRFEVMTERPASLLTKKQRSRIQNGFEEQGDSKHRRDLQRIRVRIASGMKDFSLLAAYPDRQLSLALDDFTEEEYRDFLANTTIFLERLRELRGVSREEVVERARGQSQELQAESDDIRTLDEITFRTEAEIRQATRQATRDEITPNRWDKRADGFLKIAASAALPFFGLLLGNSATAGNIIGNSTIAGILVYLSGFVLILALTVVFLIKVAQTVKYRIIPPLQSLQEDPWGTVRDGMLWIRQPMTKLQQVWRDL